METWNERMIDERKKEDVLKEIERLAKNYTPEWRFSSKNPDAGSVIAMIFAEQTADNIRKMNRMLEQYHMEFANMYGVSLRPARPASTIAKIKVVDSVSGGVPFYKGTQVIGENTEGDEVIFEAMHDLYVTNASLTEMLYASGTEQKIIPYRGEFYKQDLLTGELEQVELPDERQQPIALFSCNGNNIREQVLVIRHKFLFEKSKETICLRFSGITENQMELLADQKKYQFYYPTEQGLVLFDRVRRADDHIELLRYGDEVKQEYEGESFSAIVLKQVESGLESFHLSGIEIVTEDITEKPDFIYDGGKELESNYFLPFGEKPNLYQECYIGKAPWMGQAGVCITMEFKLSFDTYCEKGKKTEESDLRIIKRKPKENHAVSFECYIQEVSLEYFNGKGWKKLECSYNMEHLFADTNNKGRYQISFEVPGDWETTIQGGYEQQCLRLQIKRADNCYVPEVIYHYPVISDFSLKLCCREKKMNPNQIEYLSGIWRENITEKLQKKEEAVIFKKIPYEGDYFFLGFDKKFENGPISLFFEVDESMIFSGLHMEYMYSCTSGFQKLKVIDDTQNFSHSGIVVFMPPADFARQKVEGVERYWIRIENKSSATDKSRYSKPVLKQVFLNAVEVENIETGDEHDYFMDTVTSYMSFPLYADNVLSADVWVNEKDQLSVLEMERMRQEMPDQVRAEYNLLGEIEDFYVKWEETDSFDEAEEQARVYVIERGTGSLMFGDGLHVKIPQNTTSIAFKVRLTRCSGKVGNLKAGSIGSLRSNMLAIESVVNPVPAFGGDDPESLGNALLRGSTLLSSRKKLVSELDYIREATMFSGEINQVACVTEYGEADHHLKGKIRLVLLLKDFKNGSYAFHNMKNELKKHMAECCEMTIRPEDLEVIEPVFVKISIHVWLGVKMVTNSMEVHDLWKSRIEDYLEPVKDTMHHGWKIGTLPKESQIKMMLNSLETDSVLQNFLIQAVYQDDTGVHETSLDNVCISPYMVCCNGTHRIIISELL